MKKTQDYMRGKRQMLSQIAWEKLKHILKKHSLIYFQPQKDSDAVLKLKTRNNTCPACDEAFINFSSFINDTSAALRYFNQRAKKLLKLHQAAGFRKYFILFKGKVLQGTHVSLNEEGSDLIGFALTKAIEFQKIVKEFDAVDYCCNEGVALKSQAQRIQNEILHSPWLRELMAMHINLQETNNVSSGTGTASTEDYQIRFDDDGNPSLSCELIDSIKFDVDLTCPVCLETVFDPISLTCGHIMCKLCACSAASVSIVDGLKSAQPKQKCPVCRQARVFGGAVSLTELSMLLSRSCSEYWEKRLQMERVERIKQAKRYWESQSRAFVGI